jgi:hypothetical protein
MNRFASSGHEAPKTVLYAPFPRRLKAFTFDYLVILGYIALLAVATVAVVKTAGLLGLPLHWPDIASYADFPHLIRPKDVLAKSFRQQSEHLLEGSAHGGPIGSSAASQNSICPVCL